MRSRRSGSGRPLGDTKESGRRVTCKAPLGPTWNEGQASPRRRPQPFSRILTVEKLNSSKFAVSRSPAVLLFGTPRAAHGSLLEPEGSIFVTHGARIPYEQLRLATPEHFLLGHPFRGYMHIRKRSPMGKAFARVYSTGASLMVRSLWEEAP